jgi:Rha family phage regulatory protein
MAGGSTPAGLLRQKAVSSVKANGLNTLSVLGEQDKDSSASTPAAMGFVYFSQKGTPITDNLRIGAGYGRRPASILRAIDNLTCEAEFRQHNFASAIYTDAQGKPRRCVLMTKAGFLLLTLGFTGKKAASFKTSFIQHFEQLEAQLVGKAFLAPATPLPNFMERATQVTGVKQTAHHLLHSKVGKYGLIQHHRQVFHALVGQTPSEYVQAAVITGMRVASCSGRELLRRLDPARAATAAFFDEQLRRGKTIQQLTDAGLHEVLPTAFAAMLRAGIIAPEVRAA